METSPGCVSCVWTTCRSSPCSLLRPSERSGKTGGSCSRRWKSQPPCAGTGAVRLSGSTSVIRRTRRVSTSWRDLTDRLLSGVQLVISEGRGLMAAICRDLQGSAWQRCRVHAMRNLLTAARNERRQLIAAFIRAVFAKPSTTGHAPSSTTSSARSNRSRPGARRLAEILHRRILSAFWA